MVRITKEFVIRLKMSELPAYRIAQKAGIDPSTLSKLINGISPVKEIDNRIEKVAQVLGLSLDESLED